MSNRRSLITIFLIVFIDLLGFGLVLPLLPYVAEHYQANAFIIGMLTATYSLFQFIASPVLGRLSDRYGRKKILVISQIGSVVGYLLLGVARSLPMLFLARIIDGITGGNISIAQAYIADITTPKERATGMGVIGAAFGLGFAIGPAVGGFLYTLGGYSLPAYFAAAIGTLTALLTTLSLKETITVLASVPSKPKQLLRVFLNHPIGLIVFTFFLLNLAFSGMQGTFALWAEKAMGLGPDHVGYIFTYIGLCAIFNQLVILPRVINRFGEHSVFVYAVLLLSLGLAAIPLSPNIAILLFVNTFLVIGNGLATSTSQSIVSVNVAKDTYGETMGVLQSAASLGRIIGPLFGGLLFSLFAPSTPFFIGGLIVFGSFLLVRDYLNHEPPFLAPLRQKMLK